MTQDQYYNLKIGDVIYNVKTNRVVKLESCWSDTKERKEDDCITAPVLGEYYQFDNIIANDCANWDYITDNSPIEVRFLIMKIRFFELEQFVHNRLH